MDDENSLSKGTQQFKSFYDRPNISIDSKRDLQRLLLENFKNIKLEIIATSGLPVFARIAGLLGVTTDGEKLREVGDSTYNLDELIVILDQIGKFSETRRRYSGMMMNPMGTGINEGLEYMRSRVLGYILEIGQPLIDQLKGYPGFSEVMFLYDLPEENPEEN